MADDHGEVWGSEANARRPGREEGHANDRKALCWEDVGGDRPQPMDPWLLMPDAERQGCKPLHPRRWPVHGPPVQRHRIQEAIHAAVVPPSLNP